MEGATGEGPDDTSIKAVSSLRSMFENPAKDSIQPLPAAALKQPPPVLAPKPSTTLQPRVPDGPAGRASLDLPRPASLGRPQNGAGVAVAVDGSASISRRRRPSPPKSRPVSMMSSTPTQQPPPLVTVDSPRSPPGNMSLDHRMPAGLTTSPSIHPTTPGSSGGSNSPTRHTRTPSRATTPALEARMSAFLQASDAPKPPPSTGSATTESADKPKAQTPPPVNRAAKPKAPLKPSTAVPSSNNLALAPDHMAEQSDRTISPFGTPPSSGGSSTDERRSLATSSQARSYTDSERTSSSVSSRSYFAAPPTHHVIATKREQQANGVHRASSVVVGHRPVHTRDVTAASDLPEERPGLPPRKIRQTASGRTSPMKIPSRRTSPAKDVPFRSSMDMPRRAATVADRGSPSLVPPSRRVVSSALAHGFDRASPLAASSGPGVPPPRRSLDWRREMQPSPPNGHSHDDYEEPPLAPSGGQTPGPTDFPDSSQANRRSPRFQHRPWQISTEYDTRLFGACGEYVCTTGYVTKVWSVRTGELLVNMAHTENIKMTSMVFKPSPTVEDEGKRIWLGSNIGEIHELDVPSQDLVKTKSSAPQRREIIRMWRYRDEIWSLDDGELNVWPPDHKGLPSLDSTHHSFRVPKGHTFSLASGSQLWIATGKEIRIFLPSAKTDGDFHVLQRPLSQPAAGEVASGTMLSSKPDIIYFGHVDGKVSLYDRRDYSCLGVINVSLYKISSLAGVGDYLWAGYNTGMMYVYDTSVTPWRVKKDWQGHEKQICSIVADPSSLWKMDRLQVISLGTDNMLRIWDGMLEEDWLEDRMQVHDTDYCSLSEITAAILTWNAGASKPSQLQASKEDNNFFRDYMAAKEPPDIFVFGFQELVDLEDKKVTARSFFKSKKKDPAEPEHMSHQYREWRDFLTRSLEEYMPMNEPYSLLHTASMVGLFTCIFVKTSIRQRIKHVHTSEVKRGMGGLHGNKGALVLRLVLDDSSLCFINCHLAAGQTQTINRNNDVAVILEAESLPPYPLSQTSTAQHSDVFVGGGDGSMILDHEICILNGDLNYRIDTMGRDTVVKHVDQNNLAKLLERDQLLLSRKKNPGFRLRAFQENPIAFAPTYKYNVNSDEYDTSEKRRAPAWCDRILYRGLGKVRMDEYRRWEMRCSDHRPVSGRFRVRVKTVDEARREVVWETCKKEFDAVRQRVARATQVDYLTNILGLSRQEAVAALKT